MRINFFFIVKEKWVPSMNKEAKNDYWLREVTMKKLIFWVKNRNQMEALISHLVTIIPRFLAIFGTSCNAADWSQLSRTSWMLPYPIIFVKWEMTTKPFIVCVQKSAAEHFWDNKLKALRLNFFLIFCLFFYFLFLWVLYPPHYITLEMLLKILG